MKYKYLFILFAISLLSSIILSVIPAPPVCSTGCDVVQTSPYAFTFGIKNSYFGVGIFAALLLLTIFYAADKNRHVRRIIHSAIIVGSLIALYFIYLQVFVLNSYCTYCMVVDLSLLVALVIAIWKWED